jgi:signal transduction histidine kinase/ligand-binding sensor domain-containing protein
MRFKIIHHIILFVILFVVSPGSTAQIPSIRFERYTTQNGLTQNSTGALLQDSHGFLWVGTSWGLNRYDGRVFKQYNKIGENGLVDLAINSIAEDKEGMIWIATSNGVSRLDPFTEKFTNYTKGSTTNDIPSNFCSVYVDKMNNVWVGHPYGISLFNRTTKNFETFAVATAGKDILVNKYISHFLEDSKGRFWLCTSYGIKLFDRATKTYKSYHFEETGQRGLSENSINCAFEDKNGIIWAGTWGGGILQYDPAKDRFENYKLVAAAGTQILFDINGITINDHYYLLVASQEGMILADPERITNGQLPAEPITEETARPDPALSKTKWLIRKDRQDNYWISGNNGLLKIDFRNQFFQWRSIPDPSFQNTKLYYVLPDISNPQQILVTSKEGWWKYNMTTQSFSKHILPAGTEQLLGNINRFIATKNGYWFTSRTGVGFYNPVNSTIKDISHLLRSNKDTLVRAGVICTDDLGRIWFSIYRTGIRIYDPRTNKITSLFADNSSKDNTIGKTIFDLKKAPDGSIFFTNSEKLFHIDAVTLSYKTFSQSDAFADSVSIDRTGPRRILFDRKGRMLLLGGQRIYLFDHDQLVQLYPKQGVANFVMDDFIQDNHGDFWVTTNIGLYKADESFADWVDMNEKIPTGGLENINQLFRSADDHFILTGTGRIGTFSLASFNRNTTAPVIIINRVRTGAKEQYLVSLQQQVSDVSFKDAIEIELSAINFSNEKGNRIFYRLANRDNDWKELGADPVIRYEQLPPGDYTLEVKAVNEDAVWSNNSTLAFRVLPPFWRTGWFIGACVLIITGVLYGFYRYRMRQLIREERLRSHIATDLHDDIGATLSSISFYSEAIKQQTAVELPQLTPLLDKMGETSRDMVGNMSDIVWAINPQNDSFEKMLTRMQNLAAEWSTVKNIQLQFMADEKLNQLQLSMDQRRNIYLIFKEALNNALKYSDCKKIIIKLTHETGLLQLLVKDDGKGFAVTAGIPVNGGNGLKNMQHRAEEIKGGLLIDSAENSGTSVIFSCRIT